MLALTPAGAPNPGGDRSRITKIAAAAVIAAAVAVTFGVGWTLAGAGGDPAGGPSAATVPAGPGATASPSPGAGDAGGQGPVRATQPDPGSGGGDSGGGGQPDPAPAGPQIESFQVVQQPHCPAGTTQNPIEGRPVVLAWHVTGTDEVTLSIDGAGAYQTYPAEASDTINFPCAGGEGDLQEHTYLLTAAAGGVSVTETLVVAAEVHEVAEV